MYMYFIKHLKISLRYTIIVVISIKFEINPKMYIEVTGYLLQTYTSQESPKYMDIQSFS